LQAQSLVHAGILAREDRLRAQKGS
jgi:hypothetical protein